MRKANLATDPILEILNRIGERPGIYIGSHSAEALFQFMVGYTAALRNHTTMDLSQYEQFIDSLYVKYGRGGGGHSWAHVLSDEAGSDAKGFDLFFIELSSFLRKHSLKSEKKQS